jgi:hypothetical protein
MSDTNLNTSIASVKSKILNDLPTATIEEVTQLARGARAAGLDEDATVETALNSRVNTLVSGASAEDLRKLSVALRQLRNPGLTVASSISNTDGLTEGTNNVYYTDARVQSYLGSFSGHILPDVNDTYDIGSAEYKIRDLYVSDNSIHIGDKTLSRDNVDRSMEVFDELPPSSPTDIGNKGDVRIDSDYMYVCKDLNSWVRIPIDKTW